jgi:hypothetical protein
MKRSACLVLSLALISSAATAEERGAAALGAVGDVLGSIGAAAVAVNGYMAGPSTSHSLRSRHSSASRRTRSIASARDAGVRTGKDEPGPAAIPPAAPAALPSSSGTASVAPPVQPLE